MSLQLTANDWTLIGNHMTGAAYPTLGNYDQFGSSVAISRDGTTVAIGARTNIDGGSTAGQVKAYRVNNNNLSQVGIDINGLSNAEYFGSAVAINENGNVIASRLVGGVKVYEWNESLNFHIPRGNIINISEYPSSESLALSSDGNTLLVGRLHFGMKVYDFNGSNWVQRGTALPRFESNDSSGSAVAISANGNIIAYGAPQLGSGTAYSSRGGFKVFEWVNDQWDEIHSSVGEFAGDKTGISIALSADGSRIVVGSSWAAGPDGYKGKVEIFQRSGTTGSRRYSTLVGQTIYGGAGQFGESVAISSDGNTVTAAGSSQIRSYEWNGYFWVQIGSQINYNPEDPDVYGGGDTKIDLSGDGNIILAGDPSSDINGNQSGVASVYNYLPPPSPALPALNLNAIYESQDSENITIDATPVDGWPTSYTYQWYFNNYAIPALYGGTDSSIIISGSNTSNGTYQVDVANTTGSVTGQFEYRVFIDSDGDGLSDYRESNILNTNPNSIDTDGDSLSDPDEINIYFTSPSLRDTNGDGFDDDFIITNGFNTQVDYSLFINNVQEHMSDLRVGSTMIEVLQGQAIITMTLEETDDLNDWSSATTSQKTIQADAPEGTRFYRFKMAE